MKRNNFLILVIISWINLAYAGGVDGGGGKSIVCRSSINGDILSSTTLDLFEAENQYGYNVIKSNDPYMDQAVAALTRIGSGRGNKFTKDMINSAQFINRTKKILPLGVKLKDIDDSFEVISPTNCKIEQAVNFIDQNHILFDGQIWNSLDETSKASLIVHEVLFYQFRSIGAKNSIHARKAVGYSFTGLTVEKVSDKLPKDAQVCVYDSISGDREIPTKYYIYKDPQDPNWNIVELDTFDGIFILTKTYFKALAPAFDEFGSFREYFTNIEHSNIEMSLNIGFKDVTKVTGTTIESTRLVGVTTNFGQPTIPTACTTLNH